MKTDYESPLEHSVNTVSGGCREDCPACEDERRHERANTPKPMAGAVETMAALNLNDSQWGMMSRAVGYKLRAFVFERNELLAACKAVRDGREKNLTEPMRLINEAIASAEGTP